MKTVGMILPSMRPDKVTHVIKDLYDQTVPPDKVILIDNGQNIDYLDLKYLCMGLKLVCYDENIGTNQAWNHMWDLDTDYVGFVADDLRLAPNMIEIMVKGLDQKYDGQIPGMVTAGIRIEKNLPKTNADEVLGVPIRSKGACGAVLMKRCVLRCIPRIPKDFFIFFGDDWFGYWLSGEGLAFVRLNTFIYHERGPDNVSADMNYKLILRHERGHWKAFLRGKKDYSL